VVASSVTQPSRSVSSQAAKDIKDLDHHSGKQVKEGVDLVNRAWKNRSARSWLDQERAEIVPRTSPAPALNRRRIDQVNQGADQMDAVTQQNRR